MARRNRPKQQPNSATQTLDALETRGDRLAGWISENPMPILAVGATILLIAGLWALLNQEDNQADLAAASELSAARVAYRSAMGANSNSIDIPEPANPQAAQSIREEAVLDFDRVSANHPATVAAALAQLEAGKLEQALNQLDAAQRHYQAGLEIVPAGNTLAAFFWVRLGSVAEALGQWSQAADAYKQAADMPDYPIRTAAMLDAIRCYMEAGDRPAAQAIAVELASAGAELQIPTHLESQLAELNANAVAP